MEENVEYYPLTHPQKGIWYTEKMYPGTSIGNVAATLRIKGNVDYELLEKAINVVIKKNDGIRLKITEIDNHPMQYISEYKEQKIDFFDFSGESAIENLYKWDEERTRKPFELFESDLFYFAMIKVSDEDGGVYLNAHHLISDAWSMTIIGNQVMEYYSELKEKDSIVQDNNPSYIDFIISEHEYLNSKRFEKDKKFWEEKFDLCPEFTTLKPNVTNYINVKSKRKTLLAPVRFTKKVREYSEKNNISIFALFISALSMYINRITSKEKLILGTSILNRSNSEEKNTVGMFISTVPICLNISDTMDFYSLSQSISKELMSTLRHQKYPYDLLLKEARSKHKISENLYDIVLSYQNSKMNKEEHSEEYTTRWHFNGHQSNSLTIHINDRENEGNLIIDYDFLSKLFYVKEIEFIHQHIISLLWHAIDNPSRGIGHIEMLSEKEKHKILYEFNDTEVDYPRHKTIHQVFEEQVEKTPNNIAVVFEGKTLTYNELNQKANSFARILKNNGVGSEKIVGLMIERSLEMVIAMFAILKAGGAYLPIDPDCPDTVKKYMMEDAKTHLLLTKKGLYEKSEFAYKVVDLENKKNYFEDSKNLQNVVESKNIAYIIYTSGSTGEPKGVMVKHQSVINLWNWFKKKYSLDINKHVINLANFTFDVSVEEIIVSLLSGATVFIPKKETILEKTKIIEFIDKNQINIAQFVPSLLKELLLDNPKIESLNVIICGGEALEQHLNKEIILLGYNLYNHYGPTEITVDALSSKCCKDKVTLGRPVDNCKCYILDENLNLMPIGSVGELYISGEGLTRGYLNRKDLSEEVFISNPFEPGKLMYKTGDIARWYPQGDIGYIGRVDEQIKIRGHRIELGEIKHKVLNYPGIKCAVVLDRLDKNNKKFLCAYVVVKNAISIYELKAYLSKELVDYMIPSYYIILDEMPLNHNGKVDLNLLRKMNIPISNESTYVAPRNELEKSVSKIWAEVLGVKHIGVNDDFFELGGDSLSVINMISKIEKLVNKQIPVSAVYENKTIDRILLFIKNLESDEKLKDITFLRKGTTNKNIFFIHGGSGSIGGYSNLFKNGNIPLDEEFNCYAIKFDKLDGYCPAKVSIEELAQEYVKRILLIQPDGEYNLAAWCIGGQIIFEMATIFENKLNKKVNSVIMFNSFAPREWDIYYNFNLNDEIAFTKEILNDSIDFKNVNEYHNIQELWKYIVDSAKEKENDVKKIIPQDILISIPNYKSLGIAEIIYYINTMRCLHNARVEYFPKSKLNAQVYYFQPLRDTTIDNHNENVELWERYCGKKVQKIQVDADDHSIFDEDINNTIKMLNDIL